MNSILQTMKNLIEEAVNKEEIPGASYAFVTKEKSEQGFYGSKQLIPEKLPLESDSIYDMASCTKVVATTTMALQLMEQGYFTLDTHLKEILTDYAHPEVTILQLMTHTSGMPADDKNYRKCHNKQEMWDFMKNLPLQFEPGTKVDYSDFGYIALGLVIEHFVGPLDLYAQEHIFTPLEMKDTCYNPKQQHLENRCVSEEVTEQRGVIVGECHDGKGYCMHGVSGNAGLFSTVTDLTHFVQMMLQDGTYHQKEILKPSSVALLKKSFTENLNISRTLGWISSDPNQSDGHEISKTCIYHTGFTGTSIYIDFEREIGIILLTNRVHPTRENQSIIPLRIAVHDAALKEYDQLRKKESL